MVRRGLAVLVLGAAVAGCGGTAEEEPEVRVLSTSFAMGCMPVHGLDTTWIRLRVAYYNPSPEPKAWVIATARLELSGNGETGTLQHSFFPSSSGLVMPGEQVVIEHVKPPGGGEGTSTCTFCDNEAGRWELFVTWSSSQETFERRAGSGLAGCTA